MALSREQRTGIEKTIRELQPYNLWKDGNIIYFAKTKEEAYAVLEALLVENEGNKYDGK